MFPKFQTPVSLKIDLDQVCLRELEIWKKNHCQQQQQKYQTKTYKCFLTTGYLPVSSFPKNFREKLSWISYFFSFTSIFSSKLGWWKSENYVSVICVSSPSFPTHVQRTLPKNASIASHHSGKRSTSLAQPLDLAPSSFPILMSRLLLSGLCASVSLVIFQLISGTQVPALILHFYCFSLCLEYNYSLHHPLQEGKNDRKVKTATCSFWILVSEPVHAHDLKERGVRRTHVRFPLEYIEIKLQMEW